MGWVVYRPTAVGADVAAGLISEDQPQFLSWFAEPGYRQPGWKCDLQGALVFESEEEVMVAVLHLSEYCKVLPVVRRGDGILTVRR